MRIIESLRNAPIWAQPIIGMALFAMLIVTSPVTIPLLMGWMIFQAAFDISGSLPPHSTTTTQETMSAGKGDSPRHVNGDKFRENYERIFEKPTHRVCQPGAIVDGMESLGNGGWHAIDHHDPALRDEDE